jgi:signal transduction histidine kinase/CheY-like chemotaxis protein
MIVDPISKGISHEVIALLTDAYISRVNNLNRSITLANNALAQSRNLQDKSLMGKSLSELSLFYMIRGEYKRSISTATEAIKYFTELNDERGIADAKYSIAGVYYKTDNYHLGLIHLMDCLVIYRKYGDHYNQARVQKSLGTIYEYFGDRRNAIRSYKQAVACARKAKDLDLVANVYNPLSGIYLKQGKIPKAMSLIEKSINIKNTTGDIRGLAFAIYGRAKIFMAEGHYDNAEQDFQEAIKIHQEMGERLGLGMAYCKMGSLYVKTGEVSKAKQVLEEGLKFSTQYNIVFIKFKCSYGLYRIYKKEQDTEKSLLYLEQYLEQKEAVINTQTLKVIENYELITKMESLEKQATAAKEKAEIMQKQQRAEQSAEMKQNFLSTMSHEIRTPLNAVITITSLLSEKTVPEEKELLDSLKFASNHLLLVINDILDFTKLDTGKVELQYRSCNLAHLLQKTAKAYDAMATEKGLKLNLNIDPGIAAMYELDETKLLQILSNIISNGIKYTDEGQVSIQLEKIGTEKNSDILRFLVTDTGTGIPPEFYEEMFNSFSQPKSVTTRKQGGSGLGLAIVKKLVELYGSCIRFESTMGVGSAFYFDLKLERGTAMIKVKERNLDQLNNKLVLLAEDNMINALVARKLLSNWGITAEHAVNGVDALEKSLLKIYDYILMDIHMPEMNGFDATAQIRDQKNPNCLTPIFALTADITAENNGQFTTYFNGFLRKPIEVERLYEALLDVS